MLAGAITERELSTIILLASSVLQMASSFRLFNNLNDLEHLALSFSVSLLCRRTLISLKLTRFCWFRLYRLLKSLSIFLTLDRCLASRAVRCTLSPFVLILSIANSMLVKFDCDSVNYVRYGGANRIVIKIRGNYTHVNTRKPRMIGNGILTGKGMKVGRFIRRH